MNESEMDYSYVAARLDCCPDSGVLRWRSRPPTDFKTEAACIMWHKRFSGKEAGGVREFGSISYRYITFYGNQIGSHRIAWLLYTGNWPKHQIDHIDGNGMNNRRSNLRDVPQAVNLKNRKSQINNKSGITGVYWDKKRGKWVSQIALGHSDKNRRISHIGSFDNIFDAACARKSAERRLDYHENHGRS